MNTAAERATQLDLVARLHSSYPELMDAPYPDMLDHARITAYLKPVHDVGGEPCAPIKFVNKEEEYWELMTYVICEVLGWRGIWVSEERRRMGNVDVGRAEYLGLAYYQRWLLAVARVLVEKHHLGLTELTERMAEVKARYPDGLAGGKKLEAKPKSEGDGANVKRNEAHIREIGIGDPQIYAGQAGTPAFKVGDRVLVRDELPVVFYTRTPAYVRGATGEISAVAYESPAAESETWDDPNAKPEWFYVVAFNMAELWEDYTGTDTDVLRTEIPEHWLRAAS